MLSDGAMMLEILQVTFVLTETEQEIPSITPLAALVLLQVWEGSLG